MVAGVGGAATAAFRRAAVTLRATVTRRATVTLCSAATVLAALMLAGCGIAIPADPDGVFNQIQGNVLRAGASVQAGLVERDSEGKNDGGGGGDATEDETNDEAGKSHDGDGGDTVGPLADLIEDFAGQHGAEVEWTFGSEESLVLALEAGELDVAVGGFSADTPWSGRVGATREYEDLSLSEGRHPVVLVPMGQNRLLFELEAMLDERSAP